MLLPGYLDVAAALHVALTACCAMAFEDVVVPHASPEHMYVVVAPETGTVSVTVKYADVVPVPALTSGVSRSTERHMFGGGTMVIEHVLATDGWRQQVKSVDTTMPAHWSLDIVYVEPELEHMSI